MFIWNIGFACLPLPPPSLIAWYSRSYASLKSTRLSSLRTVINSLNHLGKSDKLRKRNTDRLEFLNVFVVGERVSRPSIRKQSVNELPSWLAITSSGSSMHFFSTMSVSKRMASLFERFINSRCPLSWNSAFLNRLTPSLFCSWQQLINDQVRFWMNWTASRLRTSSLRQ